MPAAKEEPKKGESHPQPCLSSQEEVRRSMREELARYQSDTAAKGRMLRDNKEHELEISALKGLDRLLKFLDSMQSTSGRARHLRDFARLHESTRAAGSARFLAGDTDQG
jgi:hypothetical protein